MHEDDVLSPKHVAFKFVYFSYILYIEIICF